MKLLFEESGDITVFGAMLPAFSFRINFGKADFTAEDNLEKESLGRKKEQKNSYSIEII